MGLFNKPRTNGASYDGQGEERQGFLDRIKYNGEADDLIWKFPYENLSIGTQLIVNQSQDAVFLKGGAICDIFGPGTHTLSANNIPILRKLINLPFGGETPFTAEVWYINKWIRRNLPFGTPAPIDLLDPLYNVSVPVRSYGDYGVQIVNSAALLQQMVGTLHLFTTADIIEQFKGVVVQKLTVCISKFIIEREITVVKINAYNDEIAGIVRDSINEEFAQYGVRITNFNILGLNFDKEDPNVIKILNSQSEAAKRRMEGYTYQEERQLTVMETAAANEGGAGQMMGAGMGIGMGFGIGGIFGQQMGNMAGVMQQPSTATPPPISQAVVYHVLINNVRHQYDLQALTQYIQGGQITRDTLVWKAGMAQWAKAGDCPELQQLFNATPPPPPPQEE